MVKAQGGEWLVGLVLWGVTPCRCRSSEPTVENQPRLRFKILSPFWRVTDETFEVATEAVP